MRKKLEGEVGLAARKQWSNWNESEKTVGKRERGKRLGKFGSLIGKRSDTKISGRAMEKNYSRLYLK